MLAILIVNTCQGEFCKFTDADKVVIKSSQIVGDMIEFNKDGAAIRCGFRDDELSLLE